MRILVYGTLKKGFHNHSLLAGSKLVCRDYYEIPNHRLVVSGLPYLIRSEQTDKFYGEIYEVTPKVLKDLDALEGHPTFYKRTYIPNLDASVYVLQSNEYDKFTNLVLRRYQHDSVLNYGA